MTHDLTLLERLGRSTARWRYPVLLIWVVVLGVATAVSPTLERRLGSPDYIVPGSESAAARSLTAREFPGLGSEQDVVVFRSAVLRASDPQFRTVVRRVLAAARGTPHVITVVSPHAARATQVAAGGHVAVALIRLSGPETTRDTTVVGLQRRIGDLVGGTAVSADVTGPAPLTAELSTLELHDQDLAEAVGVPVALVVLLVALGSVVAAGLPMVVALSSVLTCTALLTFLADGLHLDRFVTVITTVIGIGIGIDYGLFIVSRFREELGTAPITDRIERRAAVATAVGTALRTSGRVVITSGVIVVIALVSMMLIRGQIFTEIALAAALVICCDLACALTLLPALLAVLGTRVNGGPLPRPFRPRAHAVSSESVGAPSRAAAWSRFVLAHPLRLGVPALLVLVVLSLPLCSLRLGLDWGLPALRHTPAGRGEQIIAAAFGRGSVGPVDVLTCRSDTPLTTRDLAAIGRLGQLVLADRRSSRLVPVTRLPEEEVGSRRAGTVSEQPGGRAAPAAGDAGERSRSGRCAYLQIVLDRPVDSADAAAFVRDLRGTMIPSVLGRSAARTLVGGVTAEHVDLAAETVGKLPAVIGIVLGLSFCYLLAVFRSILIPIKAVVLTVLATSASLGLTVFVFQAGYGEELLGFTSVGSLQAYLPVALFALLFGLSMDYEVFLVGRIHEEWVAGRRNADAVAIGLDHTARQITAGAAIMIAVFGSLTLGRVLELKQFGFGLAVAILIDASIVRMLLVPAAMGLAGDANWYLPRWLSARTPRRHP